MLGGLQNDTVTVFGGEPGNASGDLKDARYLIIVFLFSRINRYGIS